MNAVTLHRIARWAHLRGIPLVPGAIKFVIFLVYNSVIPPETVIGKGTRCNHGGIGVVLHPKSRIGDNVLIGQGVTVGGRRRDANFPIIGNDVYIGAGAKVLGGLTVGSGSVIGANAVVIGDVPPYSVVAGVPARVLRTISAPGEVEELT